MYLYILSIPYLDMISILPGTSLLPVFFNDPILLQPWPLRHERREVGFINPLVLNL